MTRLGAAVLFMSLLLSACGPSAYEQSQRTIVLVKCRSAEAFDQQCSDAFDLVYGQGEGAKEHKRLVAIAPKSPAVEAKEEQDFLDRLKAAGTPEARKSSKS